MSTARYPSRYCPVCSAFTDGPFRRGPGGRPDASCPTCGSLERQRFLAVLLSCLEPTMGPIGVLLDIAPSTQVTGMLAKLEPKVHVRTDLGADPRDVDLFSSLTMLPLRDDSVDFLICYHVLEHIPEDREAMRELARVLAPGGIGLVQVPWRPELETDEDPSASEEERLRRFGQADHVRWYGKDFEPRLIESGLGLRRVTPGALLGAAACEFLRLAPEETVWLISSEDDPALWHGRVDETNALAAMLDGMLSRLSTERTQRDRARARVKRLRERIARQDEKTAHPRGVQARQLPRRLARKTRRVVGRLRNARRNG